MSKILFLENSLRTDKLAPLYLSAILKQKGHDVDLVQVAKSGLHSLDGVDFVAASVMTGEHTWFLDMFSDLKREEKVKILVGGPHFTFFPEDANDAIDHIVIGPGEEVLPKIIDGSITDRVVKAPLLGDLDKYPEPDRSILYKYPEFGEAGMKRFITSRDCPNSCTYCFNHLYHRLYKDEKGKFFRKRAPRLVIDEIKNVRSQYGLKMVYFNDDDLLCNKEWLLEFLDIYDKEVQLPFCGSIRANNVEPKIMERFGQWCSFINIALESSNPQTQRLLRRGNINNEMVIEAITLCKKHNVKTRLQNMIGLPVTNPLEDALETLQFNIDVDPTDSWAAIFQPFPKTDAWTLCKDKNILRENMDCTTFYDESVLNIPNRTEIASLHKWWYYAAKYKMPMDLVRILIKQKLDNNIKQELQQLRWDNSAKELYEL